MSDEDVKKTHKSGKIQEIIIIKSLSLSGAYHCQSDTAVFLTWSC